MGTAEKVLDCTTNTISEGTTTASFVGNAGATSCTGGFGVILNNGADFTELLKPARLTRRPSSSST